MYLEQHRSLEQRMRKVRNKNAHWIPEEIIPWILWIGLSVVIAVAITFAVTKINA